MSTSVELPARDRREAPAVCRAERLPERAGPEAGLEQRQRQKKQMLRSPEGPTVDLSIQEYNFPF